MTKIFAFCLFLSLPAHAFNTNFAFNQNVLTTQQEYNSSWTPEWSSISAVWHLDENSGASSVVDSSNSGHPGMPSNLILGAVGKLKTAASFNGSNSSINMGNVILNSASGDITIAFWANPSATQVSTADILSKHGDGTATYTIEQNSTTNLYYFAWGNGSTFACASSTDGIQLTANHWQHVVFSKSGSTVSYYINGVPPTTGETSCTGSFATIATNTDNLYIGRCASLNGRYFTGSLDEISVWKKALTASEIALIYKRQVSRYSP